MLVKKAADARNASSTLDSSTRLAVTEKDAEISFLVSQLQKLQKENRDLEKSSSESQKLMTKFHDKLRKVEGESSQPKSYSPTSPLPLNYLNHLPTPASAFPATPLPHETPFSLAKYTIPTTPPENSPYQPVSANHPPPNYPPPLPPSPPPYNQQRRSPSPTSGYVLAEISPPTASPEVERKPSPSRRRAHEKSPDLLEKENAKLREQCDSLVQKMYKSQQLFIQKVTPPAWKI